MARADGGRPSRRSRQSHATGSRADRSTLIKAQFSALNVAAERGTSDKTEATRQCAHDQRRRLELRPLRNDMPNSFPVGGDVDAPPVQYHRTASLTLAPGIRLHRLVI